MKIFDTILGFLPPWVPFGVIGVLLVSLGGAVWAWANAREEAGMAKGERHRQCRHHPDRD